MHEVKKYRLRKCSDVNMEYPYFEVLDDSDTILFDISKDDTGELRILFYDGVSSRQMLVAMLAQAIEDAKQLLEKE